MGLVLFVYLASITSGLTIFLTVLSLLGGWAMFGYYLVALGKMPPAKLVALPIIGLLLAVLIPDKSTMYMMAGAYAGIEIAKHESVQEVPDMLTKTMKLINKELDERLANE